MAAFAGERAAHCWLTALSCVRRHGGVKPEYLDANPGGVMPGSPLDCGSGWLGSGAAGHGAGGFTRALSAGGGQHLCCRQEGNAFPRSPILGSEDQKKIFP